MDKAKKKRLKRILVWVSLAGLVALLTAMPLLARQEAEADGPVASVLSAQAELGQVSTALHGGGTLNARQEEVNLPTGVKIQEFLVENGSLVTEGTPLARVDRVSVMTTITQVNETMEYLRQQLQAARNEKIPGTITAVAGGRVKLIFAQPGDSVMDVMLREGCLAVLSLDGLMSVALEAESPLRSGEAVDVILADGTPVSGRVDSNLNGQVVITVEDQGYAPGQTVTAQGLGAGVLQIHNPWKVTAYSGTVSAVSARTEQQLHSGAPLFTLEDRDYDGELRHRANQHRKYEELLQRLLQIYQSGTIDAPCDGMVSGLDPDSPHLLAASQEAVSAAPLVTGGGSVKLMLLGSVSACTRQPECTNAPHEADCLSLCTQKPDCTAQAHRTGCLSVCTLQADCQALSHDLRCVTLCRKAEKPEDCASVSHYPQCIHSCTEGTRDQSCSGTQYHKPACIESCIPSSQLEQCPATAEHQLTCIGSCASASVLGQCPAQGPHKTSCIHSCDGTSNCPADKHQETCFFSRMTYQAYAAKVDSVGSGELIVFQNPSALHTVERHNGQWVITSGDFVEAALVVPGKVAAANAQSFAKGDIVLILYGYKDNQQVWSDVVLYQPAPSVPGLNGFGGMDFSGMLGGFRFDGFSSFGSYGGSAPAETEPLYDRTGSALMFITPQDTVELEITLDQQDIAQVHPGMEATVTVEALRDQSFPATVTKVGTQGISNGGSSSFTVTLELDMAENMLPGMSAAATLPQETRQDILTIPCAALQQRKARTFVYTALDKDNGEPANPVEVTTGISDGEQVQILSGLEPGQTVYYKYYDTLELDTSAEAERFTFN